MAENVLRTLPSLEGAPVGPGRVYAVGKRLLDVAVCVVLLPFALLCIALSALAIRTDSPGPIFFLQPRTGRGGKTFMMFKLRTMYVDAEQRKKQLEALNALSYPDFKIPDDPRITRVGRFLRRSSLDEVPQILNVLLGQMSLVGPRPTSFGPETYELWHTARLEVTPGITGLWQVSGRSDLEFDERLRLDIAYIRNRSLAYDLWILLRTVGAVANGKGAA